MQQTTSYHNTPTIYSNDDIEFAIWLLSHVGVHYTPFNHHPKKPSPHFGDVQWYQWLRRLIRNYDGRLSFDGIQYNSTGAIDDTKNAFIKMGIAIPDSEWERAYAENSQHDIDSFNQHTTDYQQALIEWGITPEQIDTDTPYYELPECPPYINKNYKELRKIFLLQRSQITESVLYKYFDKKIDIYVPHDNINVYFVEYPVLTSMYVHPNTVIISVLDNFNSRSDFVDYIQKSLENIDAETGA